MSSKWGSSCQLHARKDLLTENCTRGKTKNTSYHQTNARCPLSTSSSHWVGWTTELEVGLHISNWAKQMVLPRLELARNHRMWLCDANPEPEKRFKQEITWRVKLKKSTYGHRTNSFPEERSDMLNSPQAPLALYGKHTSILVGKAVQAQAIRLPFWSATSITKHFKIGHFSGTDSAYLSSAAKHCCFTGTAQ